VALASLAACAYMFMWSLGTAPVAGDEARHYRRAVNYFEAPLPNFRVAHDPAYPAEGPGAVPYYDNCLWHMGLAMLWKLLGRESMLAAQAYHTVFAFLLALFTYRVGRELYGHRGGLWAWALVLSIPMNVLFSMAFYMEIPVLALAAMAMYFLLRRHAVGMGLAMGLMFLVKSPTSAVLIPPLLLAALLRIGPTWPRRLLRTALAAAVFVLVLVPDALWRMKHFGHLIMIRYTATPLCFPNLKVPPPKVSAVPFRIISPRAVLTMLGVSGPVAAVMAAASAVWGIARSVGAMGKDLAQRGLRAVRTLTDAIPSWVLLGAVPLAAYILAYVVMLQRAYDVRYLEPITLMLALLAAGPLARLPLRRTAETASLSARWLPCAAAWVMILAMAGQFLAVPPVIRMYRRLPPEVKAGYEWIQKKTEPHSHVLYLEESLLAVTDRPIIWAAAIPRYLFSTSERNQARMLRYFDIRYIAIHPTRRIADWSPEIEPTGYPISWLRTLPEREYLVRVRPSLSEAPPEEVPENTFVIYRVDYDKMPKEWIEDVRPGEWQYLLNEKDRRAMEERSREREPAR